MIVFPEDSPPGQRSAIAKLWRVLNESKAARIAETTVVSTQVHMQDMAEPDTITAILESDAGRVFYRRENPGEVLHVDVFHSPGCLDPKDVARSMIAALAGLKFHAGQGGFVSSMEAFLPYIDVQTAGGGGRIDGQLSYGLEDGVRAAHQTHVHVTALMAPETVAALFTLVAAVESAVEDGGLELRKVKRVRTARGTTPMDMSAYQASSDSLLKQSPPDQGEPAQSSMFRQEALARRLAEDIGSAESARRLLEQLTKGMKAGEFARLKLGTDRSADEIRQALTRSNLMKYDGQKYSLTQDGADVLSFVTRHVHEIEAYLRRLLWSLPRNKVPQGERKGHKTEPCYSRGRGIALPRQQGEPMGDLAVPQTVIAATLRSEVASSLSPGLPRQASFDLEDLRFNHSRVKRGSPVILLLDASASMAGRRMRAAKELARHLVLAGKDRVSIVAFQDSDVKVVCPFTRSLRKVESGLRGVQALGLTPLARGLEKALELASHSLKKPLVLCVTDGIPTVPSRTMSPTEDALEAARELARRGVRLGCIGLEPNSGFLRQMAQVAKGTLYVVEELEASTLAAIARKERAQ
ncbi:MAG: vWA domain-containing protein [Bacillota bacterium]